MKHSASKSIRHCFGLVNQRGRDIRAAAAAGSRLGALHARLGWTTLILMVSIDLARLHLPCQRRSSAKLQRPKGPPKLGTLRTQTLVDCNGCGFGRFGGALAPTPDPHLALSRKGRRDLSVCCLPRSFAEVIAPSPACGGRLGWGEATSRHSPPSPPSPPRPADAREGARRRSLRQVVDESYSSAASAGQDSRFERPPTLPGDGYIAPAPICWRM